MRRGTTPTNTLLSDVDLTNAVAVYVTYKQDCHIVVERDLSTLDVQEDRINLTLTQKETLAFDDDKMVFIQVRAKFQNGAAIASNVVKTTVGQILKDGEI